MEKEKYKNLIALLIIMSVIILGLVSYIVFDKIPKNDEENSKNGLENVNKLENADSKNNTNESTDFLKKKRYVSLDKKNYIFFENAKEYRALLLNDTLEFNGKYSLSDNLIKLDQSVETVYIHDDTLLVPSYTGNSTVYTILKEDKDVDSYVEKISLSVIDYLNDNNKIVDLIKYDIDEPFTCFKYELNASEITCSIYYKIYAKDYNMSTSANYDKYFAGSAPEYNENYISRWLFFEINASSENFKTMRTFTGL